jgi:nanoRNase/pAp phosphatase (c-di-AMP/oligoRNAs hydrolase)
MAHGGIVGRAENRALIGYLDLNPRRADEVDILSFDAVALVDTQPGMGNNSLPESVRPDIVIDHHPVRKASRGLPFTDIRSGYGAAATILCEYLIAGGIKPEPPVATALLYGIRSDTQDLGRAARKPDIDAYAYLYPLANLRMLSQISHPRLPPHYYRLLHDALHHAAIFGNCIFANLGRVTIPDMMGEVADLLVRTESVQWCLCLGVVSNTALLSLRTTSSEADAGKIMRRIVGHRGTGGGHRMLAGGQIPLKSASEGELAGLEKWVRSRFLRVVKQEPARGDPLIAPPSVSLEPPS